MSDRTVNAGETVTLLLRSGHQALDGLQMGFLAEGELQIKAADVEFDVMTNEVDGVTRVSLLGQVLPHELMLELTFKAARAGQMRDLLQLDAAFVAEGYAATTLDPVALMLRFDESVQSNHAAVHAYPNPFRDEMTVSLEVVETGLVSYRVHDVDGQVFCRKACRADTSWTSQFRDRHARVACGRVHSRSKGC